MLGSEKVAFVFCLGWGRGGYNHKIPLLKTIKDLRAKNKNKIKYKLCQYLAYFKRKWDTLCIV